MNKKRKHAELYKGVFKNDKKSCLVDLKPLVGIKANFPEDSRENNENKDISNINPVNIPNKKSLELNLKVARNMKFGTYFQRLREEIVEIFLSDNELVSFEGLFNFSQINELFNFKESVYTKQPGDVIESVNRVGSIGQYVTTENRLLNDPRYDLPTAREEVILYEDENETILKRKKTGNKSEYRSYLPIPSITKNRYGNQTGANNINLNNNFM
jgi:hypothetical protein